MTLVVYLLVIALLVIVGEYIRLRMKVVEETRKLFDEWRKSELKRELEIAIKEREKEIREDALRRSDRVLLGKVFEKFAPFTRFKSFDLNPRDARFIGDPVDYVVFKGLSEGEPKEVVFVEVKTGNSKLSQNEKKIKELVEKKKIKWEEISIDSPVV